MNNLFRIGHAGSSGYIENTDFPTEHIYNTDAGSLIQPGRWVKAGLKVNLVFSKKTA